MFRLGFELWVLFNCICLVGLKFWFDLGLRVGCLCCGLDFAVRRSWFSVLLWLVFACGLFGLLYLINCVFLCLLF